VTRVVSDNLTDKNYNVFLHILVVTIPDTMRSH